MLRIAAIGGLALGLCQANLLGEELTYIGVVLAQVLGRSTFGRRVGQEGQGHTAVGPLGLVEAQ